MTDKKIECLIEDLFDNFNVPYNETILETCLINNQTLLIPESELKILDSIRSIEFLESLTNIAISDVEKYFWSVNSYTNDELMEHFIEYAEIDFEEKFLRHFITENLILGRKRSLHYSELKFPLSTTLGEILKQLYVIIIFRELAITLLVDCDDLSTAITMNQFALINFARISLANDKEFEHHFKSQINKNNAQKRWEKHNQNRTKLKERYLKIMREGNFTSISKATDHIHAYKNPENKTHRWIYQKLTEATKGNFN